MRTAFVMIAVLAVAACTGHNFPKPAPESLILGSTTQDEVVAKYGPPYRQSTAIAPETSVANANTQSPFDHAMIAGTYTSLAYYYADRAAQVIYGGSPTERTIGFNFWNGKLYAYNFISSFAADSTNFDESKTASLQRGQTTKAEVIGILGAPTGEAVYPAVQNPDERKFIYVYVATQDRRRIAKRLEVLFDQNGKVRDLRFSSDSGPAPVPSGGGSVPIFIPPPRGK